MALRQVARRQVATTIVRSAAATSDSRLQPGIPSAMIQIIFEMECYLDASWVLPHIPGRESLDVDSPLERSAEDTLSDPSCPWPRDALMRMASLVRITKFHARLALECLASCT